MEIRTLEIAGMASVLNALRLPFGRCCRSDCEVYMTNNTDYENPMLSTESICVINNKDMSLLSTLVKRGDEHSKALRGLVVYAEINAPLYWWSEMDTYLIGTDRLSSESTMHMIGGIGFTPDKFDSDDDTIMNAIDKLETLSKEYRETRSTDILIAIKGIIPSSFKQRRIQMFSYPTLRRIRIQRHNHRLPHWHRFCEWIETLPFFDTLIMPDKAETLLCLFEKTERPIIDFLCLALLALTTRHLEEPLYRGILQSGSVEETLIKLGSYRRVAHNQSLSKC